MRWNGGGKGEIKNDKCAGAGSGNYSSSHVFFFAFAVWHLFLGEMHSHVRAERERLRLFLAR
jgi:hypothetical protein